MIQSIFYQSSQKPDITQQGQAIKPEYLYETETFNLKQIENLLRHPKEGNTDFKKANLVQKHKTN